MTGEGQTRTGEHELGVLAARNRTRIELYVEVLRLNHWFKNIFVLIGSFAAFAYFDLEFNSTVLIYSVLICVLSCFISSVNYIINGIVDKPFDAKHPRKKFRAIPQELLRPKELVVVGIILLCATLAISWSILNRACSVMLFLFFIAGILYNIRPFRTKDMPYVDVVSEAANNPIRLLLGWYALAPAQHSPPLTLLFLFLSFGCFLMTAKRYAEFRFLKEDSYDYRITFRSYTEKGLYRAMLLYTGVTLFLFIAFALNHRTKLLFSLPGVVLFVIWFLKITRDEDSIVKEPERIYVNKPFFMYAILLAMIMIWLSY